MACEESMVFSELVIRSESELSLGLALLDLKLVCFCFIIFEL